jgi:hypothetical protein
LRVEIWENFAMDDILRAIQSGDADVGVEYFTTLPPEGRKEFLDKVCSLKSLPAAQLLTALYAQVEQKDLKKLIKKGLFHLRTQGIEIVKPVASEESVLKKVAITKEQMAFASNYDHESIRVFLVAFEMRKKQFVFTHATQRFGEGLVDMMSAPMDRQGLDSLIREYRARTRSPMVLVDISPIYATYLMEEASRQSGKQVDEVRGLRRLTSDFAGDIRVPSDIHHLQVSEEIAEVSWQEVVAGTIFEPFRLSWKGMEGDHKEYDSIVRPQIVLPPHVIEEKKTAYLRELAASVRMKALQPMLSRMLEDYAYLFHRQGYYAGFKTLLKVVDSAESLDAVMQFLIKKSMDQKTKEEEPQQPGLIVSPYTRKP